MYRKGILIIFMTLFIATCFSCECKDKSWHDYNYIESTKALYKLHPQKVSWLEARDTCLSEGANLFYPMDLAEVKTIHELFEKCQDLTCPSDKSRVHIGITDLGHEGTFETVDGTPITQVRLKWFGDPTNDNGIGKSEDCVELLFNKDFQLNDITCDGSDGYTRIPFFCKKNITTFPPNWDLECIKKLDAKYHYDVVLPRDISRGVREQGNHFIYLSSACLFLFYAFF